MLDEATSIILTSSEDITNMVSELTKLSQTSAMRTVEDVNTVIEEAMGIYKSLFPNISFEFRGAEGPPIQDGQGQDEEGA